MHTSRPQSNEAGFGLIELLTAMVILNIGLLAIVAAFSSGAVALKRSGMNGTAATVADARMELYHAMTYDAVGVDTTATLDTTYTTDPACAAGGSYTCHNTGPGNGNTCASVNANFFNTFKTGSTLNACVPSQSVTGPDSRTYRVDTFIQDVAATTGTDGRRATKQITVVVRSHDGSNGIPLIRQSSVLDCSTGQDPTASAC